MIGDLDNNEWTRKYYYSGSDWESGTTGNCHNTIGSGDVEGYHSHSRWKNSFSFIFALAKYP